MLNNMRYGLMDEKLAGEAALRDSGVPFTIVRPGGLVDKEGGKAELAHSALLALGIFRFYRLAASRDMMP